MGGFALAYLMRPLGAIFFGHIGDRTGRRRMLLMSVALMTAAMLATAALPTYSQIGAAAGWLLFLLRCVMGFSVGGEYTGVVAYLLEGAPPRRRGLIASLASAASEIGALLAVGVSALTVALMDEASLQSWGWRIPFLVGAALAATVWIARSTMEESPEFHRQRAAGTIPASPLLHCLANHRAAIGRAFAISALGSITYYVGITYVPAFLTTAGALTEAASLWLSTAAAVVVILVTPFVGLWSDRAGRRPVLVALALGNLILPITMFSLMASGSHLQALGGAFVLAATGRRRQRGRGGRHGGAIPGGGAGDRAGARRHRRHRHLRRPHAVSRPAAGRAHRLVRGARRDDRPGRPGRPAAVPADEGDRAAARSGEGRTLGSPLLHRGSWQSPITLRIQRAAALKLTKFTEKHAFSHGSCDL